MVCQVVLFKFCLNGFDDTRVKDVKMTAENSVDKRIRLFCFLALLYALLSLGIIDNVFLDLGNLLSLIGLIQGATDSVSLLGYTASEAIHVLQLIARIALSCAMIYQLIRIAVAPLFK